MQKEIGFLNFLDQRGPLKFLFYKQFIWRLSDLEVHISKNKRDIENSFGTVIPYERSYKKMQKKIRYVEDPGPVRPLKLISNRFYVIYLLKTTL